jgi:GNAT superfamily N-acetyltransferase
VQGKLSDTEEEIGMYETIRQEIFDASDGRVRGNPVRTGVSVKGDPGNGEEEQTAKDLPNDTIRDPEEVESPVSIRIATPQDFDGLREMFSRCSARTIHRRFHTPFPSVPEWMLSLMLGADRADGEFLVAVAEGEVVGHAMYAMLGGGEAEMAVVVEDGWQKRGVGKAFLRELAAHARRRGVETFVGSVLPDNHPMLGLIGATFAGSSHACDDGALLVRMPLQTPEPAYPTQDLGRAA